MRIDVIIPVYKPDQKFNRLLKKLSEQTLTPDKVLIANTVGETDDCDKIKSRAKEEMGQGKTEIEVYPVKKSEYDHALTRQKMAEISDADAVLFMTQDAVPAGPHLLERLSEALENGADAAFARQVANEKADILEKYTRLFNYTGKSYVRTAEDFKKYGIKTIFCSDTCMMYKKDRFIEMGGFREKSIFAEDMTYAYRLLKAGGSLAYVSEAKVFHSHDYSLKDNFKRSFALGVNQADHPEIFKKLSSEKEGTRYVKYMIKRLGKQGRLLKTPYFILSCGVRYLGVIMGRNYKVLGKKRAIKITGNKNYFTNAV